MSTSEAEHLRCVQCGAVKPPEAAHSRDISRMTDSSNVLALALAHRLCAVMRAPLG